MLCKLTKQTVEKISFTKSGQMLVFDTTLPGFGLRVGQRTKAYFVQSQINGRTVRTTIGRHPLYSTDTARREAQTELLKIRGGTNPNTERRAARFRGLTLAEAFERYLDFHPDLSENTRQAYERTPQLYFEDWQNRALRDITPDMVIARHQRLGKEHGKPSANKAMRILRAIYNFTSIQDETLPVNPVLRLSRTRTWFRERRRQTIIKGSDLPAWFIAVYSLESDLARDYFLLLIFTGMRRREATRLRWDGIDLVARTLRIEQTKNGDPLALPIPDFLYEMLERRRRSANGNSPWVFPAESESGHFEEPKKITAEIRSRSGVEFTLHDLRRTFITTAESLEISYYALKRLLNHRSGGDVTAGYIVHDIERLRKPMQAVCNRILELGKVYDAIKEQSGIHRLGKN